ncbi:hypothetical protein ACM46_16695 [Chryseobacterium angstadtii]|uniref:DUF3347 domain-containing protein n=1 Tax=Chryseobacterium angstadtii TaxID=558151 RepID=A0A0J7I5J1_9FLAO|nr:DUF3347 domain-containing protein [Chryseobacterium angstadtii]KMQ61628.1 hypothetical protein ACM46_16695 [Chryseobacterium angstadtii]
MKNIVFSIISLVSVAAVSVACNKSPNKDSVVQNNDTTAMSDTQSASNSQQSTSASSNISTDTLSKKSEKTEAKEQIQNFSISLIIKDYLTLKNALVADNDKAAASAGKQLLATLNKVDMKTIPGNKHKEYMEIAEDAKENAEHIGDNAGKLDHQREHLVPLSKDISDLIAMFGSSQKLYESYCPMYNDGKGAIWISEAKAIKNPYYGSEMLTCGSVKKEW